MTRRVVAAVAIILLAAQGSMLLGGEAQDAQIRELKEQIRQLDRRIKELEQLTLPMKGEMQARARSAKLRSRFEARAQQDRTTYSQGQLREVESLYQTANRQWNSPQAQESLRTLIGKYAKANRTGCAVLYLGQMATGEDKEKHLKRAIKDFADCWYGDGVQVGSYARFLLAKYYQENGRSTEASTLFDDLRKQDPEAIDHRGNLLVNMIPK
jgi:TolA-binding protein